MQNRHADLNVIDYEGLTSCHPEYVNDFPHNGGRIVVRSQGYDTTIVGGQVVIEKGEFSGISKWPATLSLRTQRRPPSGYSSLVSLVSIGDEPSALHRYLLKRVGGIRRRSNRTWPEYRRDSARNVGQRPAVGFVVEEPPWWEKYELPLMPAGTARGGGGVPAVPLSSLASYEGDGVWRARLRANDWMRRNPMPLESLMRGP